MNSIWAIALLTFRESARSKALIIPFVFGIAVLASAPFTPAFTAPDRVRIMLSVALSTIAILSSLVAVLVSTTSVSAEFRDKRIVTVFTKPISRFQYLLGKTLGLWLLLAVLLLVLGLITLVSARAASWILLSPQDRNAVLAANRLIETQNVDYSFRKEKREEYNRRMSEYERILSTAKRMYATGEIPQTIRLEDMIRLIESTDEVLARDLPGIPPSVLRAKINGWLMKLTGIDLKGDGQAWREWFDRNPTFGKKPRDPDLAVEISSAQEGAFFSWMFDGLGREDLANGLRFQLVASVYADPTSRYSLGPSQRRNVRTGLVTIELAWDGGSSSQELEVRDLETLVAVFDETTPPAGTPFTITLRALPSPASVIVGRGSVSLFRDPGSFEANLLKSLILSWSVAAFLASVGVCASSFLSFPVALLLTLFVLFWGSTVSVMREMTVAPPQNPLFAPVEKVDEHGHSHKGHDLASRLGEYIVEGSWFGAFLRNGMADLQKYEGARYLPDSIRIPVSLVWEALLAFLAWRAALLIFIGWLFIRKREM
ncbi:MAG: hypothetical protein Kow00107_04860 [Planctomycetota bacterium]